MILESQRVNKNDLLRIQTSVHAPVKIGNGYSTRENSPNKLTYVRNTRRVDVGSRLNSLSGWLPSSFG